MSEPVESDVTARLIAVVRKQTRVRRAINAATTINGDLGCDGGDAVDLIEALCAEFSLDDVSDFPWDRYFYSEHDLVNPLNTIRGLFRRLLGGPPPDGGEPLSIGELAGYFAGRLRRMGRVG